MKQKSIQFLSDRDEEFADILSQVGLQKKIARVLVFLAGTPEATSLAIERGTDLRQPEVSMAVKYLASRGWIRSRDSRTAQKGRPRKVYELAQPVGAIMDTISREKKEETARRLDLVKRLRSLEF